MNKKVRMNTEKPTHSEGRISKLESSLRFDVVRRDEKSLRGRKDERSAERCLG